MAEKPVNPPLYQVHEPLNLGFPAPIIAGQTGSSELDLYLAASEAALQRAIRQADQLKPLISQGENDFFTQALGLASGEQRNATSFLQSATQYLEGRQSRARRTFEENNPRPANVPIELIIQRIHTLELLFDSMKSKDVLPRIEKELVDSDPLNTYILKNGEKWAFAYLESRQLITLDLIFAIRAHAGILESDLTKACDELLTLPPLFEKIAKTKAAIEGGFWDLCMKIVDWKKPAPFQTNSLADMPDNAPITAGQMREEIRKLRHGTGFFNDRI